MKIERIVGGSFDSIETHESKYYQKCFKEVMKIIGDDEGLIIDPFARNSLWADITNDINPNTKAKYNLEANDFLKMVLKKHGSRSVKLILFDPPFSDSQYKKYERTSKDELLNIYATSGYIPGFFSICRELLKPNGFIIKLGYNSTRPFKGLELHSLKVVNFGANRNDVIASIWRNPNHSIFDFENLGEEE